MSDLEVISLGDLVRYRKFIFQVKEIHPKSEVTGKIYLLLEREYSPVVRRDRSQDTGREVVLHTSRGASITAQTVLHSEVTEEMDYSYELAPASDCEIVQHAP